MPLFCHIRRAATAMLLFLMAGRADAGVTVFAGGQAVSLPQGAITWYFDPSTEHSLERYRQISHLMQPGGNRLDMSYRNGMFWLLIDFSLLPPDNYRFLEVLNPHINYLGAWLLGGDSVIKEYRLTGDHLPFGTRDVNHTKFVYRLPQAQQPLKLLLMVDKRNEQLHIPVFFRTENEFLQNNRVSNITAGLMTGISIFILLFTLFLYFNMRERLYIFYGLYVLFVAGYIISDLGYSFMLLYPDTPSLADFARPLTISLCPVFYILFSRTLLRVKEHFPRIYRFTNWYIVFFLVCLACGFVLLPNTGPVRVFWLVFMQAVMVLSIIPVFIYSIAGWQKGIKYSLYIIIASAIFTFFSQLYMQYITGNTVDNIITRNAVNIGFTVEISLLALALSVRFKNYKLDAEELLRKLNRQQENIFRNISEYQEKEMRRISALLHDSVGAGLSAIKFNLEAIENGGRNKPELLKDTIRDVTDLADEIRNISHNLSPLLLQKKGLIRGIRDLISQYNRSGRTQIHFESIGTLDATSFQNELIIFRVVQELLHNAVRHAHATEVMLQLMIEPELISLYIEDNGRGFDPGIVSEGLGFTQIKGLVTFVNGRFDIDSQINKGCRISIEFPAIPDEAADKSLTGRRPPYVS